MGNVVPIALYFNDELDRDNILTESEVEKKELIIVASTLIIMAGVITYQTYQYT